MVFVFFFQIIQWRIYFNISLQKQDSLGLSSHTSGQTELGPSVQIYLLHLRVCGELIKKPESEVKLSMLES